MKIAHKNSAMCPATDVFNWKGNCRDVSKSPHLMAKDIGVNVKNSKFESVDEDSHQMSSSSRSSSSRSYRAGLRALRPWKTPLLKAKHPKSRLANDWSYLIH